MDRPVIVVVGSTMIDLIAYAPRLPDAGETVEGSAFRSGFGGKGANQAVAAARFGARVALVNAVGDDDNGRATIANLEAEGIDAHDVVVVPGTSGVAPIWVDGDGMNRIVIVPGANRDVTPEAAAAAVERRRPAVVVGQFEIPQAATAAGFQMARRVGAVTILNPAPGAPIEPALLAVTDWLIPNETEFAMISGSALTGDAADDARRIAAFGDGLGASLVVTLGARGAAVRERDGAVAWVATPVVDVVDTTGAGDAFVGAFAVGLGLGWSAARSARLGCAAAADSVTRPGTQAAFASSTQASSIVAAVTD